MSGWKTPSQACEARLSIKRSRFIAYLAPAENPSVAGRIVAERSHEFADATHNCYAWVTGFERENCHFSDAGEPAGTAGKPIMNALLSAGITNAVAIVTRYYGGVKLGVRGLIEAYGQSVEEAINQAVLTAAIPTLELWIKCDYSDSETVHRLAIKLGGKPLEVKYGGRVESSYCIPRDSVQEFLDFLDGRSRQNGLEYHLKEQ